MTAGNRVATGVMLAGEAAGAFAVFCPNFFELASPDFQNKHATHGYRRRLHIGEALATLLVLARGATIAGRRNDYAPLLAALLVSLAFIAGIEYLAGCTTIHDGQA